MDAIVVLSRRSLNVVTYRFYKNGANDHWIRCISSCLKERLNHQAPYETFLEIEGRLHVILSCNFLLFIAICKTTYPVILLTETLETIAKCIAMRLSTSVEALTSEAIEQDYVNVQALLDEMLENGLPLNLESNALDLLVPKKQGFMQAALNNFSSKHFLDDVAQKIYMYTSEKQENGSTTSLEYSGNGNSPGEGMGSGSGVGSGSGILGCGSAVWWRRSGVRYSTSGVVFEVIETLRCDINTRLPNKIVNSFVKGKVLMKCFTSGIPCVRIILRNLPTFGNGLCMSFHPCVQRKKWIDEQVICFIPPDGPFTLFDYSIASPNVGSPLLVSAQFVFPNLYSKKHLESDASFGKFSIGVTVQTGFSTLTGQYGMNEAIILENVVLTFSLPECVSSIASLEPTAGTIKFIPNEQVLQWTFMRFPLHLNSSTPLKCEGTLMLHSRPSLTKEPAFIDDKNSHSSSGISYKNVSPSFPSVNLREFRPVAQLRFRISSWSMTNFSIDSVESGGCSIPVKAFRQVFKGEIEYRL